MKPLPLIIAAALALGSCQKGKAPEKVDQQRPSETASSGIKGVHREQAGKPALDIVLKDADEEDAKLADLAGKPLLVNLWASWCVPCVKELPTLDALSRRPGAPRIIAVSEDMAPRGSVEAFLEQHKVTNLEVWRDPEMQLSGKLGPDTVLPTTILLDSQGRELWRYVGDLDWTGAEAARLLAEAR